MATQRELRTLPYDPDVWPASWILELIASGDTHPFYNSPAWKAVASKVRKDQKGLCYFCLHKSPAKITKARTVHHLFPIRQRPDLALSEADERGRINLVCICPSCHWDQHHTRRTLVTEERW